jgi:hypothetical protein
MGVVMRLDDHHLAHEWVAEALALREDAAFPGRNRPSRGNETLLVGRIVAGGENRQSERRDRRCAPP